MPGDNQARSIASAPAAAAADVSNACPLSTDEFRSFKLVSVKQEMSNVKRFRFELAEGQSLNLPVASCITLRTFLGEEEVVRPYTPVTTNAHQGYFDLVIKIYDDGKMTQHLDKLKAGDSIEIKGPFKKLQYPYTFERIGMMAGGTGITPMLQVISEVLRHPEDKTRMSLIFANNTPGDIILKKELEQLQADHPDQFSVHFVVADGQGAWGPEQGSTGFITRDILDKYLFPGALAHEVSDEVKTHAAFVCGPPPFMKFMSGDKNKDKTQGPLSGYLKQLGFSEENVYKF